jgi:hypothetical protein
VTDLKPWLGAIAVGLATALLGPHLPSARWTWPLLMAAAFYPLFAGPARRGELGRAIGLALIWAASASVGTWISISIVGLEEIGPRIVRGPEYAAEMLQWVETGVGEEGSPSRFLPVHARHYSIFLVASLLSAGFAGLAFGTVLLNYMNFYVASLAEASSAGAYAIGWPVWAMVRVVGFIAGASALTHVFYARGLKRAPFRAATVRRWLIVSIGLVVTDAVLKTLLAETWRGWLVNLFP